jgi:glucose 1-dehydrogenase
MARFTGKTALITGSTTGIGAACAIRLASEGANVVINGRSDDGSETPLLAQIKAAGGHARYFAADVSSTTAVAELVRQAADAFGGLDILVNNAGLEHGSDFWDVTENEYDQVMDVNVKGVFFGTQAFVRHCREAKKGGAVVCMSSVHEEIAFPHFASYCASKGALRMFTRNLAGSLAPLGIRINNVAPGAISTPINKHLMETPSLLDPLKKKIPLGRLGKAEEVAGVVAFLASDEAAYVTGSTYFIDGGLTYSYSEQ